MVEANCGSYILVHVVMPLGGGVAQGTNHVLIVPESDPARSVG